MPFVQELPRFAVRSRAAGYRLRLIFSPGGTQIVGNRLTLNAAHLVLCGDITEIVAVDSLTATTGVVRERPAVCDEDFYAHLPGGYQGYRERLTKKREAERALDEPLCAPWTPIPNLKTIFHPDGRFRAPDGRRFDYVFPEWLRRGDLPRCIIPGWRELEGGGMHQAEITSRRQGDDRVRIGFRHAFDRVQSARSASIRPRPN